MYTYVRIVNSLVKRLFRQWFPKKRSLASYITIKEGQVFFNLDEQALQKIHQTRIRSCPLYIPLHLRILLLRYTLSYIGIITPNRRKKANIYLLPGLTFYTCYSDSQEVQRLDYSYLTPSIVEKKKLLRSVISPDGDILHQISSSSLKHPYFSEISANHHWLTAQLLNHLHANLSWIPQLIWIAFTISNFVLWWQGIPSSAIIMKLVGSFVPPFLLGILWMWLQPFIVRRFWERILSALEKQ